MANFCLFSNYYFNQYCKDYNRQRFFATSYLEALEYSKNLDINTVYIENNITEQPQIYVLLDNFVSPYDYYNNDIVTYYNGKKITYKFENDINLKDNSVYIAKENSKLSDYLKEQNLKIREFDNILVFYSN